MEGKKEGKGLLFLFSSFKGREPCPDAVNESISEHNSVIHGHDALGVVHPTLHLVLSPRGREERLPVGGYLLLAFLELFAEGFALGKHGIECVVGLGHSRGGLVEAFFWVCVRFVVYIFILSGAFVEEKVSEQVGQWGFYPFLAHHHDEDCQDYVENHDDCVASCL